MFITAVAQLSPLRGGSQARIMLADDGKRYVVKFQGNPQCTRVLANDYLACRMARMIGLTVPEPAIVQVGEKTIQEQQITFTLAGRSVAARPGLQFGSEVVTGEVWDWPSVSMLGRVRNLKEFAGVLAFDKWTGECRWPTGRVPQRGAGAKVHRIVYRFWVLLQCRRVELSRRTAAGSVRAQ